MTLLTARSTEAVIAGAVRVEHAALADPAVAHARVIAAVEAIAAAVAVERALRAIRRERRDRVDDLDRRVVRALEKAALVRGDGLAPRGRHAHRAPVAAHAVARVAGVVTALE